MIASLAYLRPATLDEAIRTLQRHPGARVLSGGQSLVAALKLGLTEPTHLIDLQRLPGMRDIRIEQDQLWIGAMATHHQVATNPLVAMHCPMLSTLAARIADQQVRNRGTLGGSIAFHDPSACWPTGVLAAGAAIVTQRREIKADDFFTGLYSTTLEADEIILGVKFPIGRDGLYLKHEQLASRFALVGVAVSRSGCIDGSVSAGMSGSVTGEKSGALSNPSSADVRVAITGLGHGVVRWPEAEVALRAGFAPEAILSISLPAEAATTDLHASSAYRVHLARVLCVRAVAAMVGVKPPSVTPLTMHDKKPVSAQTIAPASDAIAGKQQLAIGIDTVWTAIQSSPILQEAIPGCESITVLGASADQAAGATASKLQATIKVGLGFISARFVTQIHMYDLYPPMGVAGTSTREASLRISLSGSAGALGSGQGEAHVVLSGNNRETMLEWQVVPQVQGRLAQLGSRMMEATAKKLSEEFFVRLAHVMGGGQTTQMQQAQARAGRGGWLSRVLASWHNIWHWLTGK